jgi:hypothetical protein
MYGTTTPRYCISREVTLAFPWIYATFCGSCRRRLLWRSAWPHIETERSRTMMQGAMPQQHHKKRKARSVHFVENTGEHCKNALQEWRGWRRRRRYRRSWYFWQSILQLLSSFLLFVAQKKTASVYSVKDWIPRKCGEQQQSERFLPLSQFCTSSDPRVFRSGIVHAQIQESYMRKFATQILHTQNFTPIASCVGNWYSRSIGLNWCISRAPLK